MKFSVGDWIAYNNGFDDEQRVAIIKDIKPGYVFAESTHCLELDDEDLKRCRLATSEEIAEEVAEMKEAGISDRD